MTVSPLSQRIMIGCSPRAVQFSSFVWPFLAIVVLGWLVIMAGTEQNHRHISAWQIVLYGVMRQGNGDVILGNEDTLQMYRHLYFYPSFSIFISRFKPRWSSYTASSLSAFYFFSSSFHFSVSCPPGFLRFRLLIEGVSVGLFSSLIHQPFFPPNIQEHTYRQSGHIDQ